MRPGADYFVEPADPAQRRYEALRCYFVEGLAAAEVGARFGYSPKVVHQMASQLRSGRAAFFLEGSPDPRSGARAARPGALGLGDRGRVDRGGQPGVGPDGVGDP
jgi:hypothetical protein